VGVVLEAARLLATTSLPYALEIVFFGAEERCAPWGHHFGSDYYVHSGAAASTSSPVVAMMAVDMVGRGSHLQAWRLGSEEDHLTSLLTHSAAALALPLEIGRGKEWSDHVAFVKAGVPSVWLERLPDRDNHTARDLPQNLSISALDQAGRLLVHTLTSLDADDLPVLSSTCRNDIKAGDALRR
jgi:Zn-dependent M28 family amino/carboxypeptidase